MRIWNGLGCGRVGSDESTVVLFHGCKDDLERAGEEYRDLFMVHRGVAETNLFSAVAF